MSKTFGAQKWPDEEFDFDICSKDQKFCEFCSSVFTKPDTLWPYQFKKRRFCSHECAGRASPHKRSSVSERFWSKVVRGLPDECWKWNAARHSDGYGWFVVTDRPEKAHRVAYQLAVSEIPNGMWVLHKCDNPLCVNPSHLYLGTVKDNSRDAVERNRTAHGERSKSSKLKEAEVHEIRRLRKQGVKQSVIAGQFGISQSHISGIESRRFWNRLDDDVCASRHKGNEESREAFETVKDRLTRNQNAVLSFIKSCGEHGATTDEISEHFGVGQNNVSGRRTELLRDGKIKLTGEKRKTRSGCTAAVVKAV
jgi:predicted XRE-type DNA-binding protein